MAAPGDDDMAFLMAARARIAEMATWPKVSLALQDRIDSEAGLDKPDGTNKAKPEPEGQL